MVYFIFQVHSVPILNCIADCHIGQQWKAAMLNKIMPILVDSSKLLIKLFAFSVGSCLEAIEMNTVFPQHVLLSSVDMVQTCQSTDLKLGKAPLDLTRPQLSFGTHVLKQISLMGGGMSSRRALIFRNPQTRCISMLNFDLYLIRAFRIWFLYLKCCC